MSIKQKPYRDQLIAIIKDVGQEIIDRAEYMVDTDCDMITNFSITADIPQPMDGPPVLYWATSTVVKRFMNREFGVEGEVKSEMTLKNIVLEDKG